MVKHATPNGAICIIEYLEHVKIQRIDTGGLLAVYQIIYVWFFRCNTPLIRHVCSVGIIPERVCIDYIHRVHVANKMHFVHELPLTKTPIPHLAIALAVQVNAVCNLHIPSFNCTLCFQSRKSHRGYSDNIVNAHKCTQPQMVLQLYQNIWNMRKCSAMIQVYW
jgi:hypothetical protein